MKNLLLFLLLPILASSCKSTSLAHVESLIFTGPISSNPNPEIISSDNRDWKDSLDLIVVRGKYISGKKHVEIFEGKFTKIYLWKQYYPNGQLREIGNMTKDRLICIGTWKYFSGSGTLDSIVNFDKKLKTPYFDAVKLAKNNGFFIPDIDVNFVEYQAKVYWQFRRWNKQSGRAISETILIGIDDKKILYPKLEEEKFY